MQCNAGAEVVKCRCVCNAGAEVVQCRCVCRAMQVRVQCSAEVVQCSASGLYGIYGIVCDQC